MILIENIQELLSNEVILVDPNFYTVFGIYTDLSKCQLGAVIVQYSVQLFCGLLWTKITCSKKSELLLNMNNLIKYKEYF